MGGKSKSASPPPPVPPAPTATDMSPEVEQARQRQRRVSNQMTGYQSTLLTGPKGVLGDTDVEKKRLLGG
jgi:hypothetical protein